jgi:hypothetical protein
LDGEFSFGGGVEFCGGWEPGFEGGEGEFAGFDGEGEGAGVFGDHFAPFGEVVGDGDGGIGGGHFGFAVEPEEFC